jgi:hypothetical protein
MRLPYMIIGELAAEKGSPFEMRRSDCRASQHYSDAERQRQGLPSCLNNFDRQ